MARLFDDPFTFMIAEVDRHDKTLDHNAGADNIIVANRAFDAIREQYPERIFILRTRGRIIKRSTEAA